MDVKCDHWELVKGLFGGQTSKMASSKRPKLDFGEHSDFESGSVENEKGRCKETLIYIVPKKIPKARLQILNNLARKKGFPITEDFRYEDLMKQLTFSLT